MVAFTSRRSVLSGSFSLAASASIGLSPAKADMLSVLSPAIKWGTAIIDGVSFVRKLFLDVSEKSDYDEALIIYPYERPIDVRIGYMNEEFGWSGRKLALIGAVNGHLNIAHSNNKRVKIGPFHARVINSVVSAVVEGKKEDINPYSFADSFLPVEEGVNGLQRIDENTLLYRSSYKTMGGTVDMVIQRKSNDDGVGIKSIICNSRIIANNNSRTSAKWDVSNITVDPSGLDS